jgi:hypothetical protein
MIRKIISNCIGHNLKEAKFLKTSDFICTTCAARKLILRPLALQIHTEQLKFIEKIQGDMWSDTTNNWAVQVFHVLIDASTQRSHVCLLSIRNHAFAKIIAQVIKLKAKNFEHRIHSIQLDNVVEFSLQAFNDYCMAGADVRRRRPAAGVDKGA